MDMTKLLRGKQIILDKFPTHIEKTNNIKAPNKFIKVNNQLIYNSNINRFARNIVVTNLHKYVIGQIPDNFKLPKGIIKPHYVFETVYNHGSISRRNGEIRWKKPEKDYKPNWDDDNLTFLWLKIIRDVLSNKGIWTDDTVEFVRGTNYDIKFIDNLENRRITINFELIK